MRRLALVAWVALAAPGPFEGPDPLLEQGVAAYRAGRFGDALAAFEAARPDGRAGAEAVLAFDRGAALYKLAEQGGAEAGARYEAAEHAFRVATEAQAGVLRSNAYLSLGNTLHRRGRFAEAADAYRRALRANPRNDDARWNLELSLRRLEPKRAPSPGPGGSPPPGATGAEDLPPPDGSAAAGPPDTGALDAGPASASTPQPDAGALEDDAPPPEPTPPADDPAAVAREDRAKLERLEQRSRELRRKLLRGGRSGRDDRPKTGRDW